MRQRTLEVPHLAQFTTEVGHKLSGAIFVRDRHELRARAWRIGSRRRDGAEAGSTEIPAGIYG